MLKAFKCEFFSGHFPGTTSKDFYLYINQPCKERKENLHEISELWLLGLYNIKLKFVFSNSNKSSVNDEGWDQRN